MDNVLKIISYVISIASIISVILPKGNGRTVFGNVLNLLHAIALNFSKMKND